MLHKTKPANPGERKKKYVKILISLILAIALWAYATGAEDHSVTKAFTVPVEFLNETVLEEKGLVLSDVDDTYVYVVLKGNRTDLGVTREEDVTATVDVSAYDEGEYYADISVHAPSSVSIAEVKPSQLRIKIDRVVTEERDVQVNFKGKVNSDEEAVCTDYSTEIVKISGARSDVNDVVVLSANIKTSNLTYSEQEFVLTLVPVDKNGNYVENVETAVDKVTVKACLYKVKTVPLDVVTVGELPDNLELASIEAPETVTLAGPKAELDKITKISTTAVDLSQINSSAEVELKPDIPGNVRISSTQGTLKAVITVRKLDTKSFSFSAADVALNGLKKNYTADVNSPSVSIEARGTENALESLSSEDFTLSADCSGLSPGVREVPLNVTLSERAKQNNVTVNPKKIEITISSQKD